MTCDMIIPGVETTDVQRLRDILLTFIFEKVKCVESSLYGKCSWFVLLTLIRWIAIYPVDSVNQPLNNRGQVYFELLYESCI